MAIVGRVIASLFILLISPAVYAQKTHTVGGSGGWDTSVNYGNWANGESFSVGDSLSFTYDGSHAVNEVKEADYSSCNNANFISSDSNSPTTILLSTAGTHYFICPRSSHCVQGMKLAVNVTASPPSGGPSPPSSSPSPPSSGSTPSPPSDGDSPSPPATSTPSSPPPPAGNAATIPGGGKSLMVGFSVVLGAMLGLMG